VKSFLIMAVLPAVAFGCTAGVTRAHAPTMAMVPDTSSTPPDSAPVVVASTPVPSSTSSPAPFAPFTVTTWADNVLLRGNPGYLFPQLAVLQQGTPLLVLGRSPGGEWLLCQTSENRVGWVFTQLVDNPAGDAGEAPSIWPPSVQALVGTVTDPAGMPISGIQFSVVQGPEGDAQRNDAVTDDSGTFYAFMLMHEQHHGRQLRLHRRSLRPPAPRRHQCCLSALAG
jgi:hypothetical protein